MQDADWLEIGAIGVMRAFSSTGTMKRPFYHLQDPFCEKRDPQPLQYALDVFYTRLLRVQERLNTKTAKKIGKERTTFLHIFLKQLKLELQGK